MIINFDRYDAPECAKIYLASSNKRILCSFDTIEQSTASLTRNLNDTYELSFEINRFFITDNGEEVESMAYKLVDISMMIYVENVGWFICQAPTTSNDGYKEKKSITATSAQIEMQNHDLVNIKINQGTTDSQEMLADGNVTVDEKTRVEFALEQIKFYNRKNPQLSFLDILLKASGMHGWSVGYIDDTLKEYTYYGDVSTIGDELKKLIPDSYVTVETSEGTIKINMDSDKKITYTNLKTGVTLTSDKVDELTKLKNQKLKKYTALSDEIGYFDISSQDLYSFLTQDAAQFFNCIFIFDFDNFKINAYRLEQLGKDTNINISFRNLEKTNEITVDKENVFTRFHVYGSDDLSIQGINFGSRDIEDLSWFCNEKYMSSDLIEKYKLWQKDVEDCRDKCVSYSRQIAELTNVATEINDRVPLDDCSTEWYTFTDDELKEAYDNYTAQKKGYEQYYVNDNGDFDEDALKNSDDANTYYQIKDVILPTIQIEMDNRKIEQGEYPYDEDSIKKYIDTYETNWKLYGLAELKVKIKSYQDQKKLCIDGGYNKPYTDDSGHSKDTHDEMYKKYVEAFNQLNPDYGGSCQQELNARQKEYDDINNQIKEIEEKRRNETYDVYDKSTWKHDDISFTEKELVELSKLILESDYTNSNMFLSSTDDNVAMIDEQLRLLDAAKEELSTAAQPQFTYSTTLDNFLARIENKFYIDSLDVGDFIYLSIRDDYAVKLRVISMQYNPCAMNNDLSITFSNMISSKSKRDDFSYLLNSSSNHSKNSYNSNSTNNSTKNDGPQITTGLLTKLLNSGAFSNKVNQISNDNINQTVGGLLALKDLNSEMIKATDIEGKNGFFEYLQSKLISADKVVADSAELKKLSAFVASIDNLIAGNITAKDLHAIHLTADNVAIDEAVITKLIATKIQVGMLKAGTIDTDKFTISSEDGGTTIKGNTMQFKDENGVVRIQIGKDEEGKFTFCIFDESGKGVLIDSTGVKENAIADGLIKNDMVADGTLSKSKMGFDIVEGDGNGNLDASKVLIDGNGVDIEFKTIKTTVKEIDNKVDNIANYEIRVSSSNGYVFRDGIFETIYSAKLYKNGEDVTDQYDDKYFVWERKSSDNLSDREWNKAHSTGSKTLRISKNDVLYGASFGCSFNFDDKELEE